MTIFRSGFAKMTAPGGTRTIVDGNEVENLAGTSIMAQTDAEFEIVSGIGPDEKPIDFMTHEKYMWSVLKATGCPLIAGDNCLITNVKMASGIVNVYQ